MRLILALYGLFLSGSLFAQIKEDYVRDLITELASDAYLGRASGTPQSDKAAAYIAGQFSKAGLKTLPGSQDFLQRFQMVRSRTLAVQAELDGKRIDTLDILVLADEAALVWETGIVETTWIEKGGQLGQRIFGATKGNKVIFADTSFRRQLLRMRNFGMQRMGGNGSIVVVLTPQKPTQFKIMANSALVSRGYQNVVGMIEGKRKDEYVVFSGHYDHLGVGKPIDGDSIYNGANDDASGTTAVMTLAGHYAKMKKQPERTLLFVAFTAEETGGYGSTFFSNSLPPEKVVAMFNIEMIGTESKWGKNSAYITGYERSDFGKILQENLEGSAFQFHPDPYPQQNLFFRSDNATLARLGVPAHTISTSKMDSEKYYHTVNDEVETLDLNNMTEIIKAIAISSQSIVNGKRTPTRVNLGQ